MTLVSNSVDRGGFKNGNFGGKSMRTSIRTVYCFKLSTLDFHLLYPVEFTCEGAWMTLLHFGLILYLRWDGVFTKWSQSMSIYYGNHPSSTCSFNFE